jgi:hypothetical protein
MKHKMVKRAALAAGNSDARRPLGGVALWPQGLAIDREGDEHSAADCLWLLTVGFQNVAASLSQFFPMLLQACEHTKCIREVVPAEFDGIRATGCLLLGSATK